MAKIKIDAKAAFERHEKKYLLSSAQYAALSRALEETMRQDAYGLHTIGSIYYDTDSFDVIRHSLDKPDYKEKLRLRTYGIPRPDDTVFIELKKKLNGVTYKRRIPLTLREATYYLNLGVKPSETGQIFGEIDWFVQQVRPLPKVMLWYDRIALFGSDDPELRVTFDARIRWRDSDLNLSHGDYGQMLIGEGQRLMEIKTLKALPCWLSGLLASLEIYPVSFSKYGRVYQDMLLTGEGMRHAG